MIEVTVLKKHREAEGIYSFELASVKGNSLPPFSAGSHIDVQTPSGLVRQYSLCNRPDEQHRYQIAVLLEPQSRGGSKSMHDQVEVGSYLQISEPRNLFPLAHNASRSILLAGGIGITPILCMAERLAQVGADFELHYCSRSAARTAFQDRIRTSSFANRAYFHFGEQKLETDEILAEFSLDSHLYVCGPGGFMDYVLSQARQAGWPEANLHREYFAASPKVHAENESFEIQLASSGKCLQVPAGRSVADVLLDAGVDIPLSCEQGICGTCLTRVLEGEPDHRDQFLTDKERVLNDRFTPCCSRSKSARLVLDL